MSPAEVETRSGVDYKKLPEFPASRVIADDNPIYLYYQWYWKQGDGWNALNTAMNKGLKSTGRKDLWTWHRPGGARRQRLRQRRRRGRDLAVDLLLSRPDQHRHRRRRTLCHGGGAPPGRKMS